jgi:hypothetical protein
MNGGQVNLDGITDAQLEAILDVKKNNEGQFQLQNLQSLGQNGPLPAPHPPYGPGAPWGMGPGYPGQWFGPNSPWGIPPGQPFPPPGTPQLPPASPGGPQSTYNVTLVWQQDGALSVISSVFAKLTANN